jgi:hypothetical protein
MYSDNFVDNNYVKVIIMVFKMVTFKFFNKSKNNR